MGRFLQERKQYMQKIFPIILIVFDILASVFYMVDGDIRRAIYWVAAAVLTACVTF